MWPTLHSLFCVPNISSWNKVQLSILTMDNLLCLTSLCNWCLAIVVCQDTGPIHDKLVVDSKHILVDADNSRVTIRLSIYITDNHEGPVHYRDIIMSAMASQFTSLIIVYSTVYSGADQRKNSKLYITGICSSVTGEFPTQKPVTREVFPFDDVIIFQMCAFVYSRRIFISKVLFGDV